MGSFTSILVGPQIYDAANTMSSDYIILDAGVTANNLSNSQITQILSDIANTDTLLVTRENGDVTYFTNLVNFVNNYNAVKQFSNMGETQNYLLNNFIGTDKLKARIN
jgi:predicted phage tail protein